MVQNPLELVCRIFKSLEMHAGKTLRCCKWSLVDDSGGSLMNMKCVHGVSEGNEDSTGNWTRGHLCYIMTKSLATCYHVLRL